MSDIHANRMRAIGEGLAKRAITVTRTGYGSWSLDLANGTRFAATARHDDGWLLLDAPMHAPLPVSRGTELLAANASLAGGARFVLGSADSSLRVRAEVPLDDGIDLRRRVAEACAGFEAAKTILTVPHEGGGVAEGPEPGGADIDVAALCRETGWASHGRATAVAVDLDVPGAFRQAAVEVRPDARVAVSAPVAGDPSVDGMPSTPRCRDALTLLLLRASGSVRMVRATTTAAGGAARFEVVLAGEPAVAELAHAFAALSVACRVAGREAVVLGHDDGVARLYLEQWYRAHAECAR